MKPLLPVFRNENMAHNFSPVNDAKGNPMAFGVFNPTHASEARPEGALLSNDCLRIISICRPTVFDPLADMSYQSMVGRLQLLAYNEGGKTRLDCDVSQATQSKRHNVSTAEGKGHAWINARCLQRHRQVNDGLYRCDSASTSSADDATVRLSVQAVAMRVYCTNLAVMGNSQTIAALRHRKGVMQDLAGFRFAKVNDIIMDAQNSLIEMEFMQHILWMFNCLSQLMTLCETKGLISLAYTRNTTSSTGSKSVRN